VATAQSLLAEVRKSKRAKHGWRPVLAEATNKGRLAFDASIEINAADVVEGQRRDASVNMLAYNGGAVRVAGYDQPVYVAIKGLTGLDKSIPLLRDHDNKRIVGYVTAKAVGNTIQATGKMAGSSADRDEVVSLAADGFPWQASVGVRPSKVDVVKAGTTAEVNGQTIQGPAYVVRAGRLAELTVTAVGADAETAVAIAAEDNGDSGSGLGDSGPDDAVAALLKKKVRIEAIQKIAIKAIDAATSISDGEKIQAMMDKAIEANHSPETFELDLLRNVKRPQGRINGGGGNDLSGRDLELAVEASLMIELGKTASDLEELYPELILNAMDRHIELRNGLSLQDAMQFAAKRNRVEVSRRDVHAMLQASFADVNASGQSTFTLSGIFSAIANKFLKESFDFVEAAWREVADVGSVRDFKTITSYSLTGDMTYDKVAPNGELKHATAGEATYTNKAETYGKMFSLNRVDIINDDLGALKAVPKRLGRGGALKLNDVFWAAFLADGSFFTSGNKNLIGSGSSSPWYLLCDPADLAMIQVVFLNGKQMPTVEQTDAEFKQLGIQFRGYHDFGVSLQEPRAAVKSPAALSLDGLRAANQLFLDQVDYDGKKLALTPRILLTSTNNADTALELMKSNLVVTGNTAKVPNANVYAGRYKPVYSAYLTNV
jgi:hypothetical protein